MGSTPATRAYQIAFDKSQFLTNNKKAALRAALQRSGFTSSSSSATPWRWSLSSPLLAKFFNLPIVLQWRKSLLNFFLGLNSNDILIEFLGDLLYYICNYLTGHFRHWLWPWLKIPISISTIKLKCDSFWWFSNTVCWFMYYVVMAMIFYSIASEQSDDALTSARSYNLYTLVASFALAA